ncbi:Ig-like domain-containing protein, partial [Pseudomonas sp. NPDC086581]|uniref:Ig-like domain-containing protein n=1 Tax=Pseudomonas sp. NPDC086581 TaxID=3364432 RepID=UPI0038063DFA
MAVETIGLVAVTENAAKKVAVKANGKVKAQAGTKYLLQVDGTDVAPENVTVKRVGDDLQVSFEGSEKPDLTIQDFFADGMDGQLYGVSEDGHLYAYVRTDGEGFYGKLLMVDGETAPIALGGDGAPYAVAMIEDAAGFALWPLLLGLAGAGAATAAIIRHNKDDGKKTGTKTTAAPTNTKVTDNVGSIQGQLADGDSTDDTRPQISGSGIPGATIHVTDNGVEIGSTTVQPDGSWTFVPELTDGAHTIEVIQEVAGEKPSAPNKVIDIIVDSVAPTVETLLNPESDSGTKGDGVTNVKTPTIDGKTEPGATVEITFPNGEVVTTTADANGDWSITPTKPLTEGSNEIVVIAIDSAGNRSEPKILPIIVDTSTPPADAWLDPESDSGTKGDGITSDKTPTIVGKTEPGATVEITFPKGEVATTTADKNGNWSVTPPQPLENGENAISVIVTDPAGNSSEPNILPIIVDTSTPPTDAWLSPESESGTLGNGFTNVETPTIEGKTEPGATVEVTFPNGEVATSTADEDGNWSVTPTQPLENGENEISVIVTDPAGNTSEPNVLPIIVDTITPPADAWLNEESDSGTKGDGITNVTTPTIDGKTEPGSTVEVTFPTGEVATVTADEDGNWSVTPTQPLENGENAISVIVTDPAGNSSEPNVFPIIVDSNTPPADAWLNEESDSGTKGDGITSEEKPTIDGKTKPGSTVEIIFPNGEVATVIADEDGNWSVTPTQPLENGENAISVIVTDPSGNTSEPNVLPIIVDTSAPPTDAWLNEESDSGTKGDGITSEEKPTIDGKTKPGSTVEVIFPNGEVATVTADEDGNWSVKPTQPLVDGENEITVIVTDPAGNISEPNVLPIIVDTSVPPADAWLNEESDSGTKGDGITNVTTPTIDGKTEPGSTVEVTFPTGEVATVIADEDGNWSVTPTQPLENGENAISVIVTDAAGNTSEPNVVAIVVDSNASSAPQIDKVTDNGDPAQLINVPKDGWTNDTTPVISGGGAEKGDVIHVFDGKTELGSTVAKEDGTWSFEVPADKALVEGEHNLTVTAEDSAGNISEPSPAFPIHVDVTAPVAPRIEHVVDNEGEVKGEISSSVPTDDRKPVISGTANEAGLTIVVYNIVNGKEVEVGRTISGENGNWTLTSDQYKAPLAGDVKLVAKATDLAGNQSEFSNERDFTVLTAPPTAPVIKEVWNDDVFPHLNVQPKGYTNDNTALIKGTAEPNEKVKVFNGETLLGTVDADANGQWQINLPAGSADGEYAIYAVAVNAAGMESTKAGPYHFIVDTQAPAPLTSNQWDIIDDVGNLKGLINSGDVTDDEVPTVRNAAGETLPPDSIVTVYDGDKAIGSTTVNKDGTWSVDVPAPNGPHDFSVTVTDLAGNEGERSPQVSFITDVDPNAPTITGVFNDEGSILLPVERGGYTNDPTPEIHGTAKAGSLVEVYDNTNTLIGSTTADASGNWSLDTSPLAEGEHVLTVRAKEPAGNWSEQVSSFTINIDVTNPTQPTIDYVEDTVGKVQGQVLDNGYTDDPNPVFHGKGEAGTVIHLFAEQDGGKRVEIGSTTVDKDGNWQIKPTDAHSLVGSPETAYTFVAESHDKAGNHSSSDGFHLNVDFVASAVPSIDKVTDNDDPANLIDVPKDGSTNDTTPVISGSGAEKGDIIHVFDGKDELGSTIVKDDGTWSLEVPADKALIEGKHELTVTSEDPAGNLSEQSQPFPLVIDLSGPSATTTQLTIDTVAGDDIVNQAESQVQQTISGKATGEFKAGDVVSFKLNGTTYSAAVA